MYTVTWMYLFGSSSSRRAYVMIENSFMRRKTTQSGVRGAIN